jgi:hypothetical protein
VNPMPEDTIQALEAVRKSGRASMGNRIAVANLAFVFGFGAASDWLRHANDIEYMDALNEMGQQVQR